MPKIAKVIQRTCPRCATRTAHQVSWVKKGPASTLSKIARIKDKKRGTGNKGKFSKVPAKKKKQSKRPHLLVSCTTPACTHKTNLTRPRSIRFEIK